MNLINKYYEFFELSLVAPYGPNNLPKIKLYERVVIALLSSVATYILFYVFGASLNKEEIFNLLPVFLPITIFILIAIYITTYFFRSNYLKKELKERKKNFKQYISQIQSIKLNNIVYRDYSEGFHRRIDNVYPYYPYTVNFRDSVGNIKEYKLLLYENIIPEKYCHRKDSIYKRLEEKLLGKEIKILTNIRKPEYIYIADPIENNDYTNIQNNLLEKRIKNGFYFFAVQKKLWIILITAIILILYILVNNNFKNIILEIYYDLMIK